MSIKSRVSFALAAACVVIVAAAPSFHHTRPCVRCSIPDRSYLYQRFSQPLRALSNTPVQMEVPLATSERSGKSAVSESITRIDRQRQRIKSFQFVKAPTLQIDHCSISRMSVVLHESGKWSVSLQANQNPLDEQQTLNVTTSEQTRQFSDHLQRNQFHIVARCYLHHGPGQSDVLIGEPVAIPLYVKPFWVQRQEPYQLFTGDYHPHIQQYFESIDRVEIEFSYRLD